MTYTTDNRDEEPDINEILMLVQKQGDEIARLREDLQHLHFILHQEGALDTDYKDVWAYSGSNQ